MLSMLGLLVLGGAFVGLLSGLLGVGGAVIIMPLLNVFFDRLGFSVDTTQHLSLGTSLATILFTSLSSVLAHRRYGSVRADIWKRWPPASLRARSAARFSLHTFQDYSCAAFSPSSSCWSAFICSSIPPPAPRPGGSNGPCFRSAYSSA